ncbi:hypothetical protein RHMOL_Rhmol04G0378300 [Rhododendron molle]|uniref:Uncharacterized protein n=1 Tax=Rhododendron molle TaxID=49168 RepID=A0ACC0P9S3_RHOML|nr:hypothetical protein RHMOL_Rhmol04G0378300 [Rhododendron molle]
MYNLGRPLNAKEGFLDNMEHNAVRFTMPLEIELILMERVECAPFALISCMFCAHWRACSVLIAFTFTVLGLIVRGIIHVGAGKDKSNFTVSKDGKGDNDTIAVAIEDSPDHSPVQFCILVKKGVYQENFKIGRSKQNLVLMGEGIDNTVITSNGSYSSSDDIQSLTS